MSTEENVLKLAIQIGEDVKSITESFGDTSQLQTNASTLSGAVAELQADLAALNSGSGVISQ